MADGLIKLSGFSMRFNEKLLSYFTSYFRLKYNTEMTPEQEVNKLTSTSRALYRAKYRGLRIQTVIDIGASNGQWSEICMHHFPNSKYLLIEANEYHKPDLEKFCQNHYNSEYILSAAGSHNGSCFFDNTDPFGGVASDIPYDKATVPLPMICVDDAVKQKKIEGPYLLKLDTHGFEPSILSGAKNTIQNAELIIIEAYIFNLIASEAVTFNKLCNIMSDYGFRVGDFSEPLWRSKDLALWQWDLFFFKCDNPMFSDNEYA